MSPRPRTRASADATTTKTARDAAAPEAVPGGVASSRREFLKVGGAAVGALVIGIPSAMAAPLRRLDASHSASSTAARDEIGAANSGTFNQYLRIDTNGVVTITVPRSEMGQGVRTALPMILADELGADWRRVVVAQASPSKVFTGLGTGGSQSVSDTYQPLRRAGAAAREMLVAAAALQLSVPTNELRTQNGEVVHARSGKRLAFGALVAAASALPVPQDPGFKPASEYAIVGKPTLRIDGPSIVHGKAVYGLDVRIPGMRFAAMAIPPVAGATAGSYNTAAALAVSGVREVVPLARGVAVVADNSWAAFKGRSALAISWKGGTQPNFNSAEFRVGLRATTQQPGKIVARTAGDVEAALQNATRRIDAIYETPFQAHATMEPQNCTAYVTTDRCELWLGTQEPNDTQKAVATALGLTPEQVQVNVTLLGGGFGRRIVTEYAADAALLSRQVKAPVQLVWSRPDDFANDMYQPMFAAQLSAALDAKGQPLAWRHRIASPAVTASFGQVAMEAETLGARDVPYAVPNIRVEYTHMATPMPMGWWRAIQFVPNIFAREAFLDELAAAAKIDPLAYRLQLLNAQSQADFANAPLPPGQTTHEHVDVERLRAVLTLAAEKSGWHAPLPKGRGRGIACLSYDDRSYVAQVAEVEVSKTGQLRVHKITTALDVGLVINPLGITGQVESGITWALTAALYGDMRFADGRASRTSFAQYLVAHMTDMPTINTHLVSSTRAPSGAGEPPVPAVAPAIVNAIFAATAKRVRSLPITPASFA